MSKKVYVGKLAFSMTEDDLREPFSKIGEVYREDCHRQRDGSFEGFRVRRHGI